MYSTLVGVVTLLLPGPDSLSRPPAAGGEGSGSLPAVKAMAACRRCERQRRDIHGSRVSPEIPPFKAPVDG
jgi:hypothetical protein